MTTDFRALCAELLAALENEGYAHWTVTPDEDELCTRAHAALAQPEPEGPTVMEIIELANEIEAAELGQVDLVRAALARWGNL
jgi:hypothetical protein